MTNILGYVDEANKIAAIDSAVALVNPAIADNVEVYSIVLSEAWAREKPAIVSPVGELSYRVKYHVNVLLVKPSNSKMLAEAMLALTRNDNLFMEMGKHGKNGFFSWEFLAKKSIALRADYYIVARSSFKVSPLNPKGSKLIKIHFINFDRFIQVCFCLMVPLFCLKQLE